MLKLVLIAATAFAALTVTPAALAQGVPFDDDPERWSNSQVLTAYMWNDNLGDYPFNDPANAAHSDSWTISVPAGSGTYSVECVVDLEMDLVVGEVTDATFSGADPDCAEIEADDLPWQGQSCARDMDASWWIRQGISLDLPGVGSVSGHVFAELFGNHHMWTASLESTGFDLDSASFGTSGSIDGSSSWSPDGWGPEDDVEWTRTYVYGADSPGSCPWPELQS